MTKRRQILAAIAALLGLVVLALVVFIATFDANRYKPELVELVRQHTGRELQIEGDLSLSFWPQLGLATGPASLSDGEGRSEAIRFDSGQVALALRPLLSRRLVIEGMQARGLRAGLGDDPSGWRLTQAWLETGRIATGEPGTLELTGQLVPPGAEEPLALELRSGYVAQFEQGRILLDGLDVQLTGNTGKFAGLHARLRAELDAQLDVGRVGARALQIEASLPAGARLGMTGEGTVDLAAGSADLSLQGNLDESALRLTGSAKSLEPLALRYSLAADRIDVDQLRAGLDAPPATPGAPPAPDATQVTQPLEQPAPAAPAPGAQGWPLASIAGVDTEGNIEIGRLEIGELTLETIVAKVTTGGNRVVIDPVSSRLEGGALTASLTLSETGHRLQASLTGTDAGALMLKAAERDLLEGRGDLALDLRGRGETAEALRRELEGDVSLALREGAVKGFDLDRLFAAVRAALDGKLPVEQRASTGARTAFDSFTGSFRIEHGLARSKDLDLRADWVSATGAGQADLNAKTLDFLVRATLTGPGKEAAGRKDALARLQGLSVPITLSGPFDDIGIRVEVQDLIGDAARREITRRIEKELGERLGLSPGPGGSREREGETDPLDRLRGLLRR